MITDTNHGLSPENLHFIEDIFRKHIPLGVNVVVCLFGSRAQGTHSKYSDVDLLIECENLPTGALSKIMISVFALILLELMSRGFCFDLSRRASVFSERRAVGSFC